MTTTPEPTGGFRISLRTISLILLLAAIFVSGYLTYINYSAGDAVCPATGRFDCGTVLNSSYSKMGGVPISLWGLATNLIMLGILLLQPRLAFFATYGVMLFFGVIVFAFLFSVYLVYLQAFVIKAYCIWCLTHEAIITLLLLVSILRLRRFMLTGAD